MSDEIDAKEISVDEALQNRPLESTETSFMRKITENMDERYNKLRTLIFVWDEEQKKFKTRIPNGKITFIDKSVDISTVKSGTPYICAIYEREREAFARIIGEQYKPRLVINAAGAVLAAVRVGNEAVRFPCMGQTLNERIIFGFNKMKELGITNFEVIRLTK